MWFKADRKKNPKDAEPKHRPGDAAVYDAADLSRKVAAAVQQHQAGRLADAEAGYRNVLAAAPGNVDALHFLGVIAYQRREFERAVDLISAAIHANPDNAPAHNNLGNVFNAQGKPDQAIGCYRSAIALSPGYLDAYVNLGVALRTQGLLDEAIDCYRRALALAPDAPNIQAGLGDFLAESRRFEDAAACYRKAIALKPDFAALYSNLGNVLRSQGLESDSEELLGQAAECYRTALMLNPDFPEALSNLGNVLRDTGRFDEAIQCYRQALAVDSKFAEACVNLGNALDGQGRRDEALSWLRRSVALRPDLADAHASLGNALKNAGDLDQAVACYRKTLALDPRSVDTLYRLGNVLREQDQLDEASDCYRGALAIDPEHVQARWALAMCRLPAVFDANPDLERCRREFSEELDQLDNWFDDARTARGHKAVGVQTPFYLAYQEQNNLELLSRHGKLCARIMDNWLRRQRISNSTDRSSEGAVKVGIVSRHFRNHSIWNAIVKGWFQRLDRERFALLAFYLGPDEDEETLYAKARAQRFEQGTKSLAGWVEAIARESPDILIYPEIGMDAMTVRLASLRLAPVQVTTWGHPETSGLPTIDYFLSAEDMEPADAQRYYSEKLVMLPNLGCFYEPPPVAPNCPDLGSLGIESDVPVLLCPGVPFKYAPQHDWIFPEIARRLERCRLVFFSYQIRTQSEKLRRRLEGAFRRSRLEFDDFVTFIPWQNAPGFHGLLERADVFLDTIGFSTFNTAMQAAERGIPIVSREGRFLRGRTAGGILKRIGLPELVAKSDDDYADLAVRLARDLHFRERARDQIKQARYLLFSDPAPIRALEDFLSAACGISGADGIRD